MKYIVVVSCFTVAYYTKNPPGLQGLAEEIWLGKERDFRPGADGVVGAVLIAHVHVHFGLGARLDLDRALRRPTDAQTRGRILENPADVLRSCVYVVAFHRAALVDHMEHQVIAVMKLEVVPDDDNLLVRLDFAKLAARVGDVIDFALGPGAHVLGPIALPRIRFKHAFERHHIDLELVLFGVERRIDPIEAPADIEPHFQHIAKAARAPVGERRLDHLFEERLERLAQDRGVEAKFREELVPLGQEVDTLAALHYGAVSIVAMAVGFSPLHEFETQWARVIQFFGVHSMDPCWRDIGWLNRAGHPRPSR